ncbi:hypothetical protein JYB64_13290 [Algoriphagus aestuarii]|nr:hypothetical protein [Algoriphagus aestuarii]
MNTTSLIRYQMSGKLTSGPIAFRKLYEIFECFRKSKNEKILLDFDEVEWMDANLCAILDSVIFVLNRDYGHQFFIDKKHIEGKFEIFQRNGFFKPSQNNEVLIDNRDTTVRMTRFSTESDGEFYGYIGESLFNHSAFEKMPDIKASLLEHFLEVYANIQTHAKTTGPVFACGQYYPYQHQLKFTLVDIGVGFLNPISQFTKGQVSTANEAIDWALKERNTTKTDAPGGLGLTYLKNYCEKNKHGFQIITSGKCWTNDKSELNYWPLANFPGTAINLTFNCK